MGPSPVRYQPTSDVIRRGVTLKAGFSNVVDYSYEINEPNVICTEDTDDFEWPRTADEAAKLWVVVIDYHF